LQENVERNNELSDIEANFLAQASVERKRLTERYVTEEEIKDMRVEGQEILTENPEIRSLSDEEKEEKGKQDGTDRLMVLKNLLFQRVQQGEISVEGANRLITQALIENKSEAIRKMEILYEIKKRELKSLSSKQEKQGYIESMRTLQQMIEASRRKSAQNEEELRRLTTN
jgi:hypothetical protein